MTLRNLISLFLLATVIFSCKSIKPVAPTAVYTPYVLKPEFSRVNIPFQLPVSQIEKGINQQVNGLIYEDNNLADDDMMLKVWKQDNITLNMVGEEIRYRVPLKIWLKAGFKTESFGIEVSDYEETSFALAINLVSKVSIDANWKITSITKLASYDWITKPVLKVGFVEVPLTYVADKVISSQQGKLTSLLDEQTKKYVDVKPYLDEAWRQLHKPVSLSDDPAVWLKISPAEVQMTPLMGRAGYIQSSIGINAFSEIYLGAEPAFKVTSLPKLKVVRDETGSFTIFLVSDLDYSYAEQLVQKYFVGQVYSFKNGKKNIKVDSINLYGSNNKIVINLKVSGSINGNIYLKGTPYYDANSQSIKVQDVDYDLDTKNQLLKSADWLAHGLFIKKIEPYLTFSIKDQLEETRGLIQQGLTNHRINKNIVLNGRLTQLMPKEIYLTEKSMNAVVLINGTLKVDIEGFD